MSRNDHLRSASYWRTAVHRKYSGSARLLRAWHDELVRIGQQFVRPDEETQGIRKGHDVLLQVNGSMGVQRIEGKAEHVMRVECDWRRADRECSV